MRIHILSMMIALVTLSCAASSSLAQPGLTFERDQALARYSEVISRQIPLLIEKNIGKVSEAVITHRNASTMRLHFQVQAAPLQPTWAVVARDNNGNVVWSYTPVTAGQESDFWSNELRGNTVRIEVYSTEENSPLQLSIDRISVSAPVVRPEAITPPDNRAPISTQSEPIRNLARAVARLRFIGDNGKGYFCTGILVSPDLLMTNHHCPQSESERKSTLVDFDYDSGGATPNTLRFKEFIMADAELDFALYRLSVRQANRQPLQLEEAATPGEGQALLIIQHPAGEPKQVSIIDCRVSGAELRGVTAKLTDFGHLCDTLGGSSGSGVLDMNTNRVVGLHHLGFDTTSSRMVNRAVRIRLIAEYIRSKNRPDILSELGLRQN